MEWFVLLIILFACGCWFRDDIFRYFIQRDIFRSSSLIDSNDNRLSEEPVSSIRSDSNTIVPPPHNQRVSTIRFPHDPVYHEYMIEVHDPGHPERNDRVNLHCIIQDKIRKSKGGMIEKAVIYYSDETLYCVSGKMPKNPLRDKPTDDYITFDKLMSGEYSMMYKISDHTLTKISRDQSLYKMVR